jgi:uncharacterized membrane protein
MLHINAYFVGFMNKNNIVEGPYLCCIFSFWNVYHYAYIYIFMFKFSVIVMCIQFYFSVLGYAAYLTRNISSYKQQVESGFMFLMQYPGRNSPILQLDPLIRMNNLPQIFLR